MSDVVLALYCGSQAVRSLAFDVLTAGTTTCAAEDIPLSFPRPGWVEVDPEIVASAAIRVVRAALVWAADRGHDVLALGVANMRETAFAWRRGGLAALYPAVMWMSQQSAPTVDRWREQGLDALIRERTGQSSDAFVFGLEVAWLLEHEPEFARARDAGDLAVGTVDTWLVHGLTGRREHRTDTSNGSRTQLLSLRDLIWDSHLCEALGVPVGCLPELTPTMAFYGVTDAEVCGREVPITGVVADQQGSLLGHGCEYVGGMTATFGTLRVVSLTTGDDTSLHEGMVTSVAWTTEAGEVPTRWRGRPFTPGTRCGCSGSGWVTPSTETCR